MYQLAKLIFYAVVRPKNHISQIFSLPIWAMVLLWIVLVSVDQFQNTQRSAHSFIHFNGSFLYSFQQVYPILLLIELFNGDRFSNIRVAFPLSTANVFPFWLALVI